MNGAKKFSKLYTGPGYPVDPKLEAERRAAKQAIIVAANACDALIVATSLHDGHRFLSECERLLTGTGKN